VQADSDDQRAINAWNRIARRASMLFYAGKPVARWRHERSGTRRPRFDPLRPRLTRIAYRMLGSVADAEDVVQDAFLRWMGTDRDAEVRWSPQAFCAGW
jgi:hypothetical protein